jgi:AraC family transcriptional regulator
MLQASVKKSEAAFLASLPKRSGLLVHDQWERGRARVSQFDLNFEAGNWTGSPIDNLVLVTVQSPKVRGVFDFGAGRFVANLRYRHSCVIAPSVQNLILVDDPHTVRSTAIPYRALMELAGEGCALPADGDFGALHRTVDQSDRLAKLSDAFWLHGKAAGPVADLYTDGLTLELAAELLRLAGSVAPVHTGGLANWQARRVQDYIEAYLSCDLSIAQLAQIAGLSSHHFARSFRKSFGVPVHAYVTSRRMVKARELLLKTELSITEIALDVGYHTVQAFSRAFRAAAECSAQEYRRLH